MQRHKNTNQNPLNMLMVVTKETINDDQTFGYHNISVIQLILSPALISTVKYSQVILSQEIVNHTSPTISAQVWLGLIISLIKCHIIFFVLHILYCIVCLYSAQYLLYYRTQIATPLTEWRSLRDDHLSTTGRF